MANTVTSKGQVTIPKAVRERLGIGPGSQVAFELAADGNIVLRRAEPQRTRTPSRFERLRGSAGAGMTTEEIMALLRGE